MTSASKRAQAARDQDADRQLARGKTTTWWSGKSSRAAARPENAGLGDREIRALERENGKGIGQGRFAVSGRAGRAWRGSR